MTNERPVQGGGAADDNNGFVKIWLSYSAYFEAYSAAEVGRLVLAMMKYKSSGAEPEFSGSERYIWPAIRRDIDLATKIEESKASSSRQNGKNGGRPRKPTETHDNPAGSQKTHDNPENPAGFLDNPENPAGFLDNPENPAGYSETHDNPAGSPKTQKTCKEKVKVKEKVKGSNNPLPPSAAETGFGPELQSAFEDWLQYKVERRDGYKPTGIRNLISQLRNKASRYGETAVADLIRQCMASNWKGIIYDKLENGTSAGKQRETAQRRDWAELAEEMATGMGDESP